MRPIVKIEVDIHDAKELIRDIQDRATDLRPVFLKAEKDLSDIYTNHFSTNGGGRWAPLDAQYGAWKSVHFPGTPTLFRTGKLFNSIKKFSVREIKKTSATFGTDAEVAKFHQYGTWSMPKREIIFEPPMFAEKLAKDIADYIEEAD